MSRDAKLFKQAKELLELYHGSFALLKAHVAPMLTELLGEEYGTDADIVEWTAYIIRIQDFKSLSCERIENFYSGKDSANWLITKTAHFGDGDDVDDSWFRPYVPEQMPEQGSLEDKLRIGMRSECWLADEGLAQQALAEATLAIKAAPCAPAVPFADWFLEMISFRRYSECCDLAMVLEHIALDQKSLERVLAQVIPAAVVTARHDVIGAVLPLVPDEVKWDVLAFNLACYYATEGRDEGLMYKYIEAALKCGKRADDFNDSGFDAYRADIKFKLLVDGTDLADAEKAQDVLPGFADAPTLYDAERKIADFRAFMQFLGDNVDPIPKLFTDVADTPYNGGLRAVPALDAIVGRYAGELSAEALINLFELTFSEMYSNYSTAPAAVEELIRRGDTQAQVRIAQAFFKAGTYYDAGHRAMGDTVQDRLIENYFPRFTPQALSVLLEECDTQFLAADEMHSLFVDILKNPATTDDIKSRMYRRFLEYYEKEGAGSDYYNDRFQNLFRDLLPLLPDDIKAKIKELKSGEGANSAEILIHCRDCDSRFINVLQNYAYAGSLKNDTVLQFNAEPGVVALSFHMFDGADGELKETHREQFEINLVARDVLEVYVVKDRVIKEATTHTNPGRR